MHMKVPARPGRFTGAEKKAQMPTRDGTGTRIQTRRELASRAGAGADGPHGQDGSAGSSPFLVLLGPSTRMDRAA